MKNSSNRVDVRYEAICILRRIEDEEVFARELLSVRCSQGDLSKVDKNLLTALVNGVVRNRLPLDTIISFFSKISFNKIEPWVLYALRLGLYQIVYLDKIPVSAAVNTSVELVKKIVHRTDAVRFANAVLRSVERSIQNKSVPGQEVGDPQRYLFRKEDTWCEFQHPLFPDPNKRSASYLAIQYSHPEWFIKRLINRYGKEKAIEICKINNLPPKLFLRVNQQKISIREFLALLDHAGVSSQTIDDSVAVDDVAVSDIPGFEEGLFYVQDVSATRVAQFLRVEKSNRVLDVCAAPGGKATHIAEMVGEAGKVYAMDFSLKRLHLVRDNCLRMGVHNVSLVCGDASEGRVPFRGGFDRILIDAPCSNTGVLSRRAEARWRLKEKDIGMLASLQYSILETGAALLKPNGFLVYSTCSIEPEENREIIKRFRDNEPRFSLDGEEQSLPDRYTGDGGYMARLCKTFTL